MPRCDRPGSTRIGGTRLHAKCRKMNRGQINQFPNGKSMARSGHSETTLLSFFASEPFHNDKIFRWMSCIFDYCQATLCTNLMRGGQGYITVLSSSWRWVAMATVYMPQENNKEHWGWFLRGLWWNDLFLPGSNKVVTSTHKYYHRGIVLVENRPSSRINKLPVVMKW